MSEYWLISAPGDKTCQQTWDTLNNATKSGNLSINYKFPIPDLKVGTLDQLVGLSDDLGKLDTFVEGVTRKVAQYLGEVLEDQRDKLQENLMANNSVESYSDPGGGEPPPATPTSPVCDSAFSEQHGCWPCEHREHSEGEVSSGRSSPRWEEEEDDERAHHVLTQGPAPPGPLPIPGFEATRGFTSSTH